MQIKQRLTEAVVAAIEQLYGQAIPASMVQLDTTRKEFEGHLTLVVFPFLKMSRQRPEATAEQIGTYLVENLPEVVARYNVIKGFLNIVIADTCWAALLDEIRSDEQWGLKPVTDASPLVMIEYSSPNTNKPLHLGHVRNNLLGWALARVMEANGNRVVKTNIVNDRGIHICKSMLAWLKWGNGETPESTGKKGDHLIGDYYVAFDRHYRAERQALMDTYIAEGMTEEAAKERAERESPLMQEARQMLVKWEQGDAEVRSLWQTMNSWVYAGFDETYRALGVGFDKIYYESQTYLEGKAKVEEGLEKGLFYRREDGSVWADLTAEGLDEKLLLRSDGTSVYMTQDIGTAKLRYEDYPIDKMIYVVGNEQNYHFQVLSILLDKLGFRWGKDLVHFSYGMVELPNGKMKSREGTVVDADDLIAKMVADARELSRDKVNRLDDITDAEADEIARIVGMGALKYFILKVDARKNMLFNPEESIDFNGNTGPFIQYTYARIRSILRKSEQGCTADASPSLATDPSPKEKGVDTFVDAASQSTGAQSDGAASQSVGMLSAVEIALIQQLAAFGASVRKAGTDYNVSVIANYCYDLAKAFNGFYHDFPILREEDGRKRALRLSLCAAVAQVIRTGMGLLGIEVPERM
ncbi:MAG: arginine--tRNA ligase [Bacteroidaceae bacterium]|nr:arginine--tRNA ligase [Bacteroidaceae bacterium]